VTLAICELLLPVILWEIVWFLTAISRGCTVNELHNPWNYKYLFEIKRFQRRVYYEHRTVGKCNKIINLLKFRLNISQKRDGEQTPLR
jgi:hypothetical protein